MNELKEMIEQNAMHFEKEFGHQPFLTGVAPGRINIIGEHTDYNEGLSLATAINRWVLVSIRRRDDSTVVVKSGNYNSTYRFEVGQQTLDETMWHKILNGITSIMKNNYGIKNGFEAYIWGNVPLGSGVSSSAAIEIALLNSLRALYQLDFSDTQLVLYSQETEHTYLKVQSGLLDQYTSQFSVGNKFILLDFQSITHRYIPANLMGYQWVLVNTMVKRELSGSKYSERVEETKKAFLLIQGKYSNVKHFRDLEQQHTEVLEDLVLRRRMLHYIQENRRVTNFVNAILQNDLINAGNYLSASHKSLKENYEVSCEELDFLQENALAIKGCIGSRMMGGGFGGCTINLVKDQNIENFKLQISSKYVSKFGIAPEVNIYKSASGAFIENHYIGSAEKPMLKNDITI
ncbi:MAG TPA: galactokinase [Cytophagaceae bacterium]|jgi:galactokinase|nr:galactokinase [Cytophagaceae bacterium]